ncbi:Catalase-3 like [Actinidia chinensis var. chinensis]|uniref:Catalase-3 like n=1 Tax=Actinidia chinensis var. chinensis TaxID=1590841 RepID=A0A2R6P6K1_ACTCC|nr:Catalase-3 like [Actinidia chinensis var. chinensis]
MDTNTAEESEQELQQSKIEEDEEEEEEDQETRRASKISTGPNVEKDLKKVVQKTAATFVSRASTATKNPIVPGTALYTVFEVQGYALMLIGGALSFNLIFSSNEPGIWRLTGMWSIWMFTIPSLQTRDCSKNDKEALNYLFLLVPLLNARIPFFWKSFAVVWLTDMVAFFGIYAWKSGWLQKKNSSSVTWVPFSSIKQILSTLILKLLQRDETIYSRNEPVEKRRVPIPTYSQNLGGLRLHWMISKQNEFKWDYNVM